MTQDWKKFVNKNSNRTATWKKTGKIMVYVDPDVLGWMVKEQEHSKLSLNAMVNAIFRQAMAARDDE